MKETRHDILMAVTQPEADKSFGQFDIQYDAKYHKAAECLIKDKVEMLAF
ncbi:Mobile element protein (plasmid) [Candidatus Enterovibrio escicola]|uniref:Mobile element protein n=1 Tax=Candidatus Enterovibrio escicola TaxID=1927127 RepID=A0A2A5T1R0_9GAMM|nr:Mobile element protein [Candidatus Enterovibrio escacola]